MSNNPFLINPFKLTFVPDNENPFTRTATVGEEQKGFFLQPTTTEELTTYCHGENPFMEKRTSPPFTSRNPFQFERSFKTSTILQSKTLISTTPQRKRIPRPVRLFLKSPSTPAPKPTKLVDYTPSPDWKAVQYTASPPLTSNKRKAEEPFSEERE